MKGSQIPAPSTPPPTIAVFSAESSERPCPGLPMHVEPKEVFPPLLTKYFSVCGGWRTMFIPGRAKLNPFFHSACLSGLRCCLASARVLGVSSPGDLPSSFLAGSLPALPLGSFPWFLYHRKPGQAGSYSTYFPPPPPLCSSQTWGNDFSSRPPGLLPAPLPQPSQKRLRVEGFPFHFIFHHFYPFRMVRI